MKSFFPLLAAQIRPQLKHWPCLVLGNLGRRWPTGKSPDEGDKNNHRFYDENLSKLRVLQVKKEGLFSDNIKLLLSIFPCIWGRIRSKKFNLWWRRYRLEVQKNLILWGMLSLCCWFLGAAGWPGLAGAGLWGWKKMWPFDLIENSCLSHNWCQW